MITVVNVKRDKRPEVVYIGHRLPGRPASPLDNPYRDGRHTDPFGLYRTWLWQQLQADTPARRELERLATLHRAGQDILLGCWCAPAPCHGQVIKAAIEWLAARLEPKHKPAQVGTRVCFTNSLGLQRYGEIVAINDTGNLIQVAWEAWPAYLASIPYPDEDDRRYCAPHRSWTHMPGEIHEHYGAKFEVIG